MHTSSIPTTTTVVGHHAIEQGVLASVAQTGTVCVRERETKRETERQIDKERERKEKTENRELLLTTYI